LPLPLPPQQPAGKAAEAEAAAEAAAEAEAAAGVAAAVGEEGEREARRRMLLLQRRLWPLPALPAEGTESRRPLSSCCRHHLAARMARGKACSWKAPPCQFLRELAGS
jgi:hypothetical protein